MNVTVDLINDNKIQTTIDSNAIKNWVVTALKTIEVDGEGEFSWLSIDILRNEKYRFVVIFFKRE